MEKNSTTISTLSSAPLKKRSKMMSCSDTESAKGSDEHTAAAALAELNRCPESKSKDNTKSRKDDDKKDSSSSSVNEGTSDDVASVCSTDSSVVPEAVHKPRVSNMMVDHTYTDYSVVKEDLLSYLNNNNDDEEDSESDMTIDEKKSKEKALRRIRKIFGDISPTRKNSGGVVKPFPEKLMEVLDRGDMDNIITWLPHGRAFIVRHAQQLREIVLPRFFKQSKFMSFTRQLNLWGFKRITKGTDAGAYYHELFLRGRPRLSMLMRRQKIKGTGIKLTPNPDTEPNFYKISKKRPLPAVATDKRKLEPLPPISNCVNTSRSKRSQPTSANFADNEATMRQSFDLYLQQQQQLEHKKISQNLMEQQQRLSIGSMGSMGSMGSAPTMMPPLAQAQPRLSFPDTYSSIDLFQHGQRGQQPQSQHQPQAHTQFQRLSAPVTQTDFSNIAASLQSKAMEEKSVASAEQLLREVRNRQSSSNPVNPVNPVEELKQRLLNAVHSLEQAQASQQQQQHQQQQHFQQAFPAAGMYGGARDQNNMGFAPMNQYQSLLPQNNYMMQQHQQPAMFSQVPPARRDQAQQMQESSSISALMTALDQTRQVAAAAQAQSSLLQQVANDLALGRHLNKK